MIVSGKTGLITYLNVLRNAGFKYLVCCSSTMVEASALIINQFLAFQLDHLRLKYVANGYASHHNRYVVVDYIRCDPVGVVGGGGGEGRRLYKKFKKGELGLPCLNAFISIKYKNLLFVT